MKEMNTENNGYTDIHYPVGMQNFSKLREDGKLYVDKTQYLPPLIEGGGYYFLSRPRRFGKSLLLSTLEAYYLGRRDLFRGLALDNLTDDWEPHPVLHIDLSNREYKDSESLTAHLNSHLERWEELYGDEKKDRAPEERFAHIIRRASQLTGEKVVILVDEYDKPLLATLGKPELADSYRSQLKAVYSNLKTLDEHIEFAMLTGVSRFSKVSIFSDLNNLDDISFDDRFAAICGITADELDRYFQAGMGSLARKYGKTPAAIREELRSRYDGYHFTSTCPDIYNPFGLMKVFRAERMGDFWFETATPTFLWRLIGDGYFHFRALSPSRIGRKDLESAGLLDPNPLPAFFQTGYLTIKGYDEEYDEYELDYPNEEVRRDFLKFLYSQAMPIVEKQTGFSIPDFSRDVRAGRIESFMKRMESLIASIPYSEHGRSEDHFQNAVYLLFTLLGYYARIEDRTADGRIDLQVATADYIYIFEFKIDSTAEEAMAQIRRKKYWLREACAGKEIWLIGASFDTKTGRLGTPLIEQP